MARYRYRTGALHGRWRSTAEAAADDAIRARQARRDETTGALIWLVPGEIEEEHIAAA